MKKIKSLLIAACVTVALATGISSCNTDKCKDVVCQNDGTCVEGTCDCAPGYFGNFCASSMAGSYSAAENGSSSGAATFVAGVTFTGSTASFSNFYGVFVNKVNATIDGTTITIASQEPDADKFFVSGSGTITTNAAGKVIISITYTVIQKDGSGATIATDNVTSTYTQI